MVLLLGIVGGVMETSALEEIMEMQKKFHGLADPWRHATSALEGSRTAVAKLAGKPLYQLTNSPIMEAMKSSAKLAGVASVADLAGSVHRDHFGIAEMLRESVISKELVRQHQLFREVGSLSDQAALSASFLSKLDSGLAASLRPAIDGIADLNEDMSILKLVDERAKLLRELTGMTMAPSLAVIEGLKILDVGTLAFDPTAQLGVFTRFKAPELRPVHTPIARVQHSAPRAVQVDLDVKCFCSRCGKELVLGGRYGAPERLDGFLGLWIVPLCTCMTTWDGTGKDLVRAMKTKLRPIDGGGQVDGHRKGQVRIVRLESVKDDADDDDEGDDGSGQDQQ